MVVSGALYSRRAAVDVAEDDRAISAAPPFRPINGGPTLHLEHQEVCSVASANEAWR